MSIPPGRSATLHRRSDAVVLIVDGNEFMRSALEARVDRLGFSVVTVADGAAALTYLEHATLRPRLVLIDALGDRAFVERLVADEAGSEMSVMVMTVEDDGTADERLWPVPTLRKSRLADEICDVVLAVCGLTDVHPPPPTHKR